MSENEGRTLRAKLRCWPARRAGAGRGRARHDDAVRPAKLSRVSGARAATAAEPAAYITRAAAFERRQFFFLSLKVATRHPFHPSYPSRRGSKTSRDLRSDTQPDGLRFKRVSRTKKINKDKNLQFYFPVYLL